MKIDALLNKSISLECDTGFWIELSEIKNFQPKDRSFFWPLQTFYDNANTTYLL